MAEKNTVQVTIAGRTLTLGAYESEEYLHKVASYVDNKIIELNKMQGIGKLSPEVREILLELNIADDFFKAKRQIDELEEELDAKEKELYDLKHELVSTQMKLDNSGKHKQVTPEKK